jgi:hypothetical protein
LAKKILLALSTVILLSGAAVASEVKLPAGWDAPYLSVTFGIRNVLTAAKQSYTAGLSWNKPLTPHIIFSAGLTQAVFDNAKWNPTVTVGFIFRTGRRLE